MKLNKTPSNVPKKWVQNIKPCTDKPLLAISQCLLGDAVRYDGQKKYQPLLVEYLQTRFCLIAVCPEVEIGLGVPRAPLELSGTPIQTRMTGRDDKQLDITETMLVYCRQKTLQLNNISGYVFKSRSPSCGLDDTPIFQYKKEIAQGAGLFARAIKQHYKKLPLSDEKKLGDEVALQQFSHRVLHYYHQQRQQNK